MVLFLQNIFAPLFCIRLLSGVLLGQPVESNIPSIESSDLRDLQQVARAGSSDSLRALAHHRMALLLMRESPDSAFFYAKQACQGAERINDPVLIGNVKLTLATLAERKGDVKYALQLSREAYLWGEKGKSLPLMALAQRNMGGLYLNMDSPFDAILSCKKSALLFEQQGDTANAAAEYVHVAGMYADELKDSNDGVPFLHHNCALMEGAPNHDPSLMLATTYLHLGTICQRQDSYTVAIGWLLKSLQMFRILGNKANAIRVYPPLVAAYIGQKEYDRAITYAESAIQVGRELADEKAILAHILQKAEAHCLKGEPQKALADLEEAEPLAASSPDKKYLMRVYGAYAATYQLLHKPVRAKEYESKAAAIAQAPALPATPE